MLLEKGEKRGLEQWRFKEEMGLRGTQQVRETGSMIGAKSEYTELVNNVNKTQGGNWQIQSLKVHCQLFK